MARITLEKAKMQTNKFSIWVSGKLATEHVTYEELGNYLNLSKVGIHNRIHGKTRWTLEEFYRVQEFFKEDYKS